MKEFGNELNGDINIGGRMAETRARTIAKSIVYRLGTFVITLVVCEVITGDWIESLEIAIPIMIFKTIWYWIHERWWKNIHWGYLKDEIKDKK